MEATTLRAICDRSGSIGRRARSLGNVRPADDIIIRIWNFTPVVHVADQHRKSLDCVN